MESDTQTDSEGSSPPSTPYKRRCPMQSGSTPSESHRHEKPTASSESTPSESHRHEKPAASRESTPREPPYSLTPYQRIRPTPSESHRHEKPTASSESTPREPSCSLTPYQRIRPTPSESHRHEKPAASSESTPREPSCSLTPYQRRRPTPSESHRHEKPAASSESTPSEPPYSFTPYQRIRSTDHHESSPSSDDEVISLLAHIPGAITPSLVTAGSEPYEVYYASREGCAPHVLMMKLEHRTSSHNVPDWSENSLRISWAGRNGASAFLTHLMMHPSAKELCIQPTGETDVIDALRVELTQLPSLPRLETLKMAGCYMIGDVDASKILASYPNLTFVDLSSCMSVGDVAVMNVPKTAQTVLLANCENVTDNGLDLLAANAGEILVHADLSGLVKITDRGVRGFLAKCVKLETIKLSGCYQLRMDIFDVIANRAPQTLKYVDVSFCYDVNVDLLHRGHTMFDEKRNCRHVVVVCPYRHTHPVFCERK
ncbi:cell surface glycoprotein 1-like [Ixodes scapularis]